MCALCGGGLEPAQVRSIWIGSVDEPSPSPLLAAAASLLAAAPFAGAAAVPAAEPIASAMACASGAVCTPSHQLGDAPTWEVKVVIVRSKYY